MKSAIGSKSCKRKFSMNLFIYNLIIGFSKKNKEIIPKRLLNRGIHKCRLKFNIGLVLIGL